MQPCAFTEAVRVSSLNVCCPFFPRMITGIVM
jgi:hypothetical protein